MRLTWTTVIYIIIGILGLNVSIAFHEAGHFIAAKLCKIKVQESFRNSTLSFRKGSEIFQFFCIQTAFCVFFTYVRL